MLQINSSTSSIVTRAFRLENRFRSPLSVSKVKLDKWRTLLKVITLILTSCNLNYDILP